MCHLTTTGRVTGRPRTIEIWFALQVRTVYLLSGGRTRSDWVKNLLRDPKVECQIGGLTMAGRARLLTPGAEDELARRLLLEKYQPHYGGNLSGWARRSTAVAIDLTPEAS